MSGRQGRLGCLPAARYVKTEIRRSLSSMAAVIFVLAISFVGPLFVDNLRSAVRDFMNANSRLVLTADAAIGAYRPISTSEIDGFKTKLPVQRVVQELEFLSMLSGRKDSSLLVEIHAVVEEFPLVGQFEFATPETAVGAAHAQHAQNAQNAKNAPNAQSLADGQIWISRDAAETLGLGVGDSVHIGAMKFEISRLVTTAPGVSRSSFGMAPRVYMRRPQAEATGLIGFGSQVQYRVYLEFKKGAEVSVDEIKAVVADPDLYLRTPDDAIQGIDRFNQAISLYLAVVALFLFALGSIAAFYMVRVRAIDRMQSAAVAIVFGAEQRAVIALEFVRTIITLAIAAVVSVIIVLAAIKAAEPSLQRVMMKQIPVPFTLDLSLGSVSALFLFTLALGAVFSVPFALRIHAVNLTGLFADSTAQASDVESGSGFRSAGNIGLAMISALLFATLAVRLCRDLERGLQLSGMTALAIATVLFVGHFAFRGLGALGRIWSPFRLLGTQLSRSRFAVRLAFVTIALSTFVTTTVGQLMVALTSDLKSGGLAAEEPDFFLFNIPDFELARLKAAVSGLEGRLAFVSPMILARMKTKNGEPIRNERFERFPVRITWRDGLIASETLVAGHPFVDHSLPQRQKELDLTKAGTVLPQISVEARFAEQNNMAIGDRLEFDVQGVQLIGEIANLRRVRWTDFNPNFFISFQPGVLEDAPKTWIANLVFSDRENRVAHQAAIVRAFPDLSLIDVSETLGRLKGLVKAVLVPAEWAAILASGISMLMLICISVSMARLRMKEVNLFGILGAEPRRVRRLFQGEFTVAGFLGAALGGGLGLCAAAWVSVRYFDLSYVFDPSRLAVSIGLPTLLSALIGNWLYFRVARGLGIRARVV